MIDSNYADRKFSGLAASYLRWELHKAGVIETEPERADILLCTVSSQQGISSLRGSLRKLKNNRARVVVGGGAAYAPAVFDSIADVVCCGEGQRFIRTLLTDGYEAILTLSESYIPNENRMVIPNEEFPWDCPPLQHPDGTVRVFASRGCRYRCLFCQTGWESSYRTNPNQIALKHQVRALEAQQRSIAIVTNDGADVDVKLSGQSEFVSVRFSNLKRLMPLTKQVTKSVRIGVEGVSERLRNAVGKPVDNDELLAVSSTLLKNGVGVRWFFVVGLPGETDLDYADLRYLITGLHRLHSGVVMMNFHAFIPQPATPLGVLPLVDDYWERFDEFRRWFFHGPGFTRRCQIVAPSRHPGRLKRAMESMAASEIEVRAGWFERDNRNWRVQYRSSPAVLRRIASVYAGKVGLSL